MHSSLKYENPVYSNCQRKNHSLIPSISMKSMSDDKVLFHMMKSSSSPKQPINMWTEIEIKPDSQKRGKMMNHPLAKQLF